MSDTPKPPVTRNQLGQIAAIKLHAFMSDKIDTVNGYAVYRGDWSDEKIAAAFSAEINAPVTRHNVAGLRQEMWGRLKPNVPVPGGWSEAIRDLKTAHEVLVSDQAALETAHKGHGSRIDALEAGMKSLLAEVAALKLALKHKAR